MTVEVNNQFDVASFLTNDIGTAQKCPIIHHCLILLANSFNSQLVTSLIIFNKVLGLFHSVLKVT